MMWQPGSFLEVGATLDRPVVMSSAPLAVWPPNPLAERMVGNDMETCRHVWDCLMEAIECPHTLEEMAAVFEAKDAMDTMDAMDAMAERRLCVRGAREDMEESVSEVGSEDSAWTSLAGRKRKARVRFVDEYE